MRRSQLGLGVVAYWMVRPLLFLYLNESHRTRVIVVHDQKIAVVRAWLGDGKWSLPGGGIHKGELPEVSAARELKEETKLNLSPGDLKFLSVEKITSHGITTSIHYFFYISPTLETLKAGRPEITSADWLNIEKLDNKVAGIDVLTGLRTWKESGHFGTIKPVSESDN
ncbi:MAG TPA: NUDIX hydrolase [Candidatus Saccharimonadales bacterium]|nr:NUDIX hydrolase [Candidatus Saccharimonadales bacterium]